MIGVGRFVVSYGYSSLFTLAAYRVSRNIRHEYLKAALSQEIAHFDFGSSGSVAMQASSNGRLVQAGTSEKLGLVIQGVAAFISAFVLAFITNWKLSLITGSIAPATVLVMSVASYLQAKIEVEILGCSSQAGSFAEGILASARTIQAFDLRSRLMGDYDDYLQKSAKLGRKRTPILGCLFSAEYFILVAGIGLCFWQAVRMLARDEVKEPGDVFTYAFPQTFVARPLAHTSQRPHVRYCRSVESHSNYTLLDRFHQSSKRRCGAVQVVGPKVADRPS